MCWNTWSSGRKKEVKILIFEIFILEWKNTPRGLRDWGQPPYTGNYRPRCLKSEQFCSIRRNKIRRVFGIIKFLRKRDVVSWKCGPTGHRARQHTLANRRGKSCKKSKDSHSKEPLDAGISL